MNIPKYIESGVLEAYVMGSASETDAKELLHLKEQHTQIQKVLQELEIDMEYMAGCMAMIPPPGIWAKISDHIDETIVAPKPRSLRLIPDKEEYTKEAEWFKQERYIEVEAESSHMRVHKTWKWVLAAVFILSKIFLITAIYFYLENRQAQQQLQELKLELKNTHINK